MHRLLVALLSAFDAVIAAAVAVAAVLAPLTILWVFGIGRADWAALWPASATIWQLGNLVPLPITLPDAYLGLTGIAAEAASFTLSLAPLGFAAFTALFAARSGGRAAGASAWITGVLSGSAVFAALAAVIALTSRNDVAHPRLWQAIAFPALVYALGALAGAVIAAWRGGDDGLVDRVHDRVDAWRGDWPAVPGLAVRGAAAALSGLVGLGALALAVALITRGGGIIALYEKSQVDALGATLITLGQLMYLPTLVAWAVSWIAGPGFALGVGTAVSPPGTQLGVVPGIPILGAVPESVSPWMLLVLLLPIGAGAVAGWLVRSRLVQRSRLHAVPSALPPEHEQVGPRVVLALLVALLSGAGAALLAAVASGSLGPGRLAEVGPSPGPVAVAVGLEVLVGAGILLLSPRRADAARPHGTPRPDEDDRPARGGFAADPPQLGRTSSPERSAGSAAGGPDAPADPAEGRPAPLPSVD